MGLTKIWKGATEGQAQMVGVVLVGGMAVFLGYKTWKTGQTLAQGAKEVVTKDLNPASGENLIYTGVNKVGGALTGDSGFSLGGWIYDKTHPGGEQ